MCIYIYIYTHINIYISQGARVVRMRNLLGWLETRQAQIIFGLRCFVVLCVYIYIYIYIYTCVHTYIYIYIYYTYIYIYICMVLTIRWFKCFYCSR